MSQPQVAVKDVSEIRMGRFSITLDEEKLNLLYDLCTTQDTELQQIQEMTDFMLELCDTDDTYNDKSLRYMKYLKNLRGAFEYMASLDVRKI